MNTNTAYNNYNFKPFLGQNHLLHQSAHPNRPNHLFRFLEWKNCKNYSLTITIYKTFNQYFLNRKKSIPHIKLITKKKNSIISKLHTFSKIIHIKAFQVFCTTLNRVATL